MGELGSSSGSHKDAYENEDNLAVLEGDSGASDSGSPSHPQPTPVSETVAQGPSQPDEPPSLSVENHVLTQKEADALGRQLPIIDIPAEMNESSSPSKLSLLETNLISQLESEIAGLLGSIKVQASSIKETLKKQKSILTEDTDAKPKDIQVVGLEDVKINLLEEAQDAQTKLDMSINSVIRVEDEDDALNTSVSTVLRVASSENSAKDKAMVEAESEEPDLEGVKGDNENLILSRAQFEVLISDLKTRHVAEKRMLQCDLSLCKKVIKLMVEYMRAQSKEKQRNQIRMLQIKKLQESNKFLRDEISTLSTNNHVLTTQCSKLKALMMSYEQEALYQRLESDYVYEQLAQENDTLKRLLLINHDFTSSIEERIREIEQ